VKTKIDQEDLLDRGGHPTLRELLSHLVFSPANGNITLNTGRLILQRVSQTHHLRNELISRCGPAEAHVIMSRLGFQAGIEDAKFVRSAWPNLDLGDVFTAGSRLHTLCGCVRAETVHNDFDFRRGKFSAEFLWRDSAEATEYRDHNVKLTEPACSMQVGYASGYATSYFGRLVVYKEVECLAMGHKHCRVVGKLAEMWGENDEAVRSFRRDIARPMTSDATPGAFGPSSGLSSDVAQIDRALGTMILSPIRARLDVLAGANIPALVTGPCGSGKMMAGRYLHDHTFGSTAPLTCLDCRELAAPDLDVLLPATQQRGGRGRKPELKTRTLVLANIEDMNSQAQQIVTDYLATRKIALSGTIEFRVIAMSELNPSQLSTHPRLRRDLYHRLAIMPLSMPALNQRRKDIGELARLMLRRAARDHGSKATRLSDDAVHVVTSMRFPGNLLELESLIVGAMLASAGGASVDAADLEKIADVGERAQSLDDDRDSIDAVLERAVVSGALSIDTLNHKIYQTAMRMADGNVSRAARTLSMTRAQLAYRLTQTQNSTIQPVTG
jgi:transcriptional regulator with AAA-type ATPase domain